MMSWQPRMIERNPFIAGPRALTLSTLEVRMCHDSGISFSIAASQKGS